MLSTSKPWRAAASSVGKCLSGPHSLVIIIILFLLGFVLQTFIRRNNEDIINSKTILPVLENKDPPQTGETGDHRHNKGGSNDSVPTTAKVTIRFSNTTAPKVEKCQAKSHLVFLKTHKTASSTVQNILYRYGESRGLTFALPRKKDNRFSYPHVFRTGFVEGFGSRKFHILCNHMRFKKSEVEKVMPEDSFYFSILRHPVSMMESIFIYMRDFPAFQSSSNLSSFLEENLRNYKTSAANGDFTHNNLAFDFGFDNTGTADSGDLEERAGRVIAGIERDFHLILINEYFDESMILLKNALCWSLQDVVSFKLNGRSDQSRQPVPEDTAEKIQRWNALDWKIYLHFNATFWEKVRSVVGEEEMKKEVSELRKLQAELTDTCLKGGEAVNPSQIKEAGLKPFQSGDAVILGYNLNPDLDQETEDKCIKLITPELQYTYQLYDRQFN